MHSGEEVCRRSKGCSGEVKKERQNSVLDVLGVHCSVLDLQVCSLSWQLNIYDLNSGEMLGLKIVLHQIMLTFCVE